jgi:acyl transferase domain-containing protein
MNEIPAESAPRVAVVGLAARFPGARSVDELWRNLRDGVESISYFTPEELAGSVDPLLLADPRYVRAKGMLPDADLFDAAFFGFTPREAEQMDPQHRIFLECAWEALEDAGCDSRRSGGRTGVYAGSGPNAYLIFNLLPHREIAAAGALHLLLLNDRDFLASRTSYKLGLTGPSLAVQTACSTSLVAIHLACQALLTGECDLALAGGVSVSPPLAGGYLYQEGSILSPDGHCRAFDAAAAGSVDANGCGVVALKRLDDALADGDRIHAVVRGSAVTNDGPGRVGFTAPGVDGQAAAISEALLLADVDPDTIGFVQAHGSGTALGDPIEVEALTRAFRRAGARRTGACAIGSVKTNLGHTSAAAGVAGFLAATLALTHKTLPPSLHFERPNPRIDFAASPFYVCTETTPWQTGGAPRRAGVSSFGLGGTNAHVVLEEAPAPEPSEPPTRQPQLLVLSARTPEALSTATSRLADHLALPGGHLADTAWTLQTGRRAFEHRRFVVARDLASAAEALRDPARTVTDRCEGDGRRAVVFLFPGLGDQAVDMAREIYETEPFFREQVDLCATKLAPHLGCDLREVLFAPGPWSPDAAPARQETDLRALLRRPSREEGSAAARLDQTAFAQPACFVVEYALAQLLMEWGIQPEAMIGYSIGEYVAACLAGALSLDDALALVARRAQLIQELPPGAMLAVPLAEEEIRPLLDGGLSLCATNGPSFCVVGGPEDAVALLEARLAGRGASCLRLQTTHAFHSAMMEPAAGPLTSLAAGVATRAPGIPYLSNVTGTWITPKDLTDPAYWARHMRGTVRFAEGLAEVLREPGRAFLEIGPGGTLGTLVRQHPDSSATAVTVPTLRRTGGSGSDLDDLVAAVGRLWAAGAEIDWERFQGGARRHRVTLPTYPFERRRFWIDGINRIDPPSAPSLFAEPIVDTGTATESLPPTGGRKAPRPELAAPYVTPRNDLEAQIAGIWEELFGIEPIGADDNFLELGGHSLLAIQIMTHLRSALDVELSVTALFETPTVAGLARVIAKSRGEETEEDLEQLLAFVEGLSPEEALEALSRPTAAAVLPPQPPPVRPVSGPSGTGDWPLSFDQERLLQMHLDNPDLVSWNVDVGSRIRGPLQVPHLLAAFAAIIHRHAAWRTTFPVVDGQRVQRVHPWVAPDISLIDLTALPPERREAEGRTALFERTRARFDLERGPLVRVALARLSEREHLSAFTIHHLVTDWITFQVCWHELLTIYEAHRNGRTPALPALPVQYPDFVLWEREWLQGEVLQQETEFWQRKLEGFPRTLELPTDKPRPAVQSQRGGLLHIQAGHERTERLRSLAWQEGVTMFMALLAVLDALFHRVSGHDKIVVGSNSANRARPELESVFGLFLTQVPFPVDLGGDPTFRELLGRVRRAALSVYAHQNLPISRLIEALGVEPDPSRSPVVQALLLVLEGQSVLRAGDLDFEAVPLFDGNSRWDLMFAVYDYHDVGLSGPFEYNADIFEPATAERLLELLYQLIDVVTADPDIRLSHLPALHAPRERETEILQGALA